jgi:hypothetical protein
MRILLSEGSGLTSRQVARRLGSLGHEVEILSSSKICLTRFTRHVSAVHDVPRLGVDPFGWLVTAERLAVERNRPVVSNTGAGNRTVGASEILERRNHRAAVCEPRTSAEDKIFAFRTLEAIGASQPQTFVISTADDLQKVSTLYAPTPAYVPTGPRSMRPEPQG